MNARHMVPVLVLACILSACATTEQRDEEPPAQLGDAQPQQVPEKDHTPHYRILAQSHRVVYPIEKDFSPLWDAMQHGDLPRQVVSTWLSNAIRVGVVDESELGRFAELIGGELIDSRAEKLLPTKDPTSFIQSPKLNGPVKLHLEPQPMGNQGNDALTLTLVGGRCRILARGVDDNGTHRLELIPQHFLPQSTLLPRTPMEKELDGQVFEALTLSIPAGTGQVLVLGLSAERVVHQVDPVVQAPKEGDQGVALPTPGDDDPEGMLPDPQTIPDADTLLREQEQNERAQREQEQDTYFQELRVNNALFGTRLFAAERLNKPVQLLIFIRVDVVDLNAGR